MSIMAEPQSTVRPEELQTEEWRIVPDYESLYEVSSMGRVRRIATGGNTSPGKILRAINHKGYCRVNLGGRKLRIHRLVMLAFVGAADNGQEVNHKNGNKADNRLCNLEYVTHMENVEHAKAHGLTPPFERRGLRHCPERAARGAGHPRAKLTEEIVRAIRRDWATGSISTRDIARRYGIAHGTVVNIVYRHTWRHIE
jgi:hypothetical protein